MPTRPPRRDDPDVAVTVHGDDAQNRPVVLSQRDEATLALIATGVLALQTEAAENLGCLPETDEVLGTVGRIPVRIPLKTRGGV